MTTHNQSPPAAPTEYCWLVEHFLGDGTGNSTGSYHTGFVDLSGNSRATNDPRKAKRYSRQEAETVAAKLGHTLSGTWRAVEHGFDVAAPTPSKAGAVTELEVQLSKVLRGASGVAYLAVIANRYVDEWKDWDEQRKKALAAFKAKKAGKA